MRARHALAVAALLAFWGCGGDEATPPPLDDNRVELLPDRDNTLYEDPLGQLSNGAGEHLFAGITNQPRIRRAMLRFDVAGGQIPAGAMIDSARLTLHVSRTNAGATTVTLHRLTAQWGEGASNASGPEGPGGLAAPGDATWIHTFFDTSQWTTPGGDFVTAPSGSVSVQAAGFYTWPSTAALVGDVRAWRDNPGANFGWILIGDESGPLTTKRFDSRENSVVGNRPRLTVFFTP